MGPSISSKTCDPRRREPLLRQTQRRLFANGLVDLGNLIAGALVFGELISPDPVRGIIIGLGVALTLVSYFGAHSLSS